MFDAFETHADRMQRLLASGAVAPTAFRQALSEVPAGRRDAWVDRVFQIGDIPEDEPDLPRGCVPYLPVDVATLLRAIDAADVTHADVFVDVGAGVGRALMLTHLLTGAGAIGVEIQSTLVRRAHDLIGRLATQRVSVVRGDASERVGCIPIGTVFFLYCPFSGDRLQRLIDALEPIGRARPIRLCAVDVPLPAVPWLTRIWSDERQVIYRSG